MKQYQCINCGEMQESDKNGTCPYCGYRMYAFPYNREKLLISEIKKYILSCIDDEISADRFTVYKRKGKKKVDFSEDIKRFPTFEEVFDYTVKVRTTEMFSEHLENSIQHLKAHCDESFSNSYTVNTDNIKKELKNRDKHILSILEKTSLNPQLTKLSFPGIKLQYSETPNTEYKSVIAIFFDKIEQLYDKIIRFIKINHIFGAFFRKSKMPKIKLKEKSDRFQVLKMQIEQVQKILDKKYELDLFSDGMDEIQEMMSCLWKSICLLMTFPVFIKENVYTVGINGVEIIGTKNLIHYLSDINVKRYQSVKEDIMSYEFLSDLSEKQIFDVYDTCLKQDITGYFGVNHMSLKAFKKYEEKLNTLIGLESIKKSIRKIKAYSISNKGSSSLNLHMCFYGNPGTGKTEVARVIAGILYENGILLTDKVIETDRSGLVAEYIGQTAVKTMGKVHAAMGGVLFIDEAYSLNAEGSRGDYGTEAIAALIKAMEDYRGKFCVILAGYRNQMVDMINLNPGFKSRIQFTLDFPNYSREELCQIAEIMLSDSGYQADNAALEKMLDVSDVLRKNENFANAREMRSMIEQVIMCQNLRVCDPENRNIEIIDVNTYIQDANIALPTSGISAKDRVLSGEEELENLIGLENVKRMVRKIRAYAKRNHNTADFNLHMCFMGNPGTGKTEVARMISRILYDMGVLAESKLVETDAGGLIGKYVGETAPKTIAKIRDSLGGVLFIDEAYALADADSRGNSYGDEAIAALIKEMEDKRGQVCVILAGYQDEMERMIASNPGFASRIQFKLMFPDYTIDELREIAEGFLTKKGYTIGVNAMDKVIEITEYFRKQPDFANARTIRNILDQVIMNQNLRVDDDENFEISLSDVEDYIIDENINLFSDGMKGKIGF